MTILFQKFSRCTSHQEHLYHLNTCLKKRKSNSPTPPQSPKSERLRVGSNNLLLQVPQVILKFEDCYCTPKRLEWPSPGSCLCWYKRRGNGQFTSCSLFPSDGKSHHNSGKTKQEQCLNWKTKYWYKPSSPTSLCKGICSPHSSGQVWFL